MLEAIQKLTNANSESTIKLKSKNDSEFLLTETKKVEIDDSSEASD